MLKKIVYLLIVLTITILNGCNFQRNIINEEEELQPLIRSEFSYDFTVSLSANLIPEDDNEFITYQEAALIGAKKIFEMFEENIEGQHIVMHFIDKDNIISDRGLDEWLGNVFTTKENSSPYRGLNRDKQNFSFRIDANDKSINYIRNDALINNLTSELDMTFNELSKFRNRELFPTHSIEDLNESERIASKFFSDFIGTSDFEIVLSTTNCPLFPLPSVILRFDFKHDDKFYSVHLLNDFTPESAMRTPKLAIPSIMRRADECDI